MSRLYAGWNFPIFGICCNKPIGQILFFEYSMDRFLFFHFLISFYGDERPHRETEIKVEEWKRIITAETQRSQSDGQGKCYFRYFGFPSAFLCVFAVGFFIKINQ